MQWITHGLGGLAVQKRQFNLAPRHDGSHSSMHLCEMSWDALCSHAGREQASTSTAVMCRKAFAP